MALRLDVVGYLKLFRFPLVFTAIADSATGYLLNRSLDVDWTTLVLLAITSAGLYFFGMALNDIADREKDKTSAPGRVLPSGRLSIRRAGWASALVLLLSLAANLAIGPSHRLQRVVVWLLVVVSICAYNCFLKVPPAMGLVRALNFLLGGAVTITFMRESGLESGIAIVILPTFVYVSSLTYASTLEDGNPERAKLAIAAAGMALGALFAAALFPAYLAVDGVSAATGVMKYLMGQWHGFVFATPLVAWIAWRAWQARDKKGVMLLVRDGIGGIILLDAAIMGSVWSSWIPALCVASLVIPAAVSVAIFKRLA